MKKKIIVKRKNILTNASDGLYKGSCIYEKKADGIKINYLEENKETAVQVDMYASKQTLRLQRDGETKSTLNYEKGTWTKGTLSSVYGELEVDLFTTAYIVKDDVITLAYDIYSEKQKINSYRIIWNIQEE